MKVFITGRSAITACGETAEQTWQAILAQQSGLGEITQADLSTWPCRLGGELKNFQPARLLPDKKLAKVVSRQDVMGIHAAVKAVEDSALIAYRDTLDCPNLFNENTAIFVGSPGNKYFQQYDFLPLLAKAGEDMQLFANHLFETVHPMWLLRILPNNVLAYAGITYGFKGPNHNITNHAVSGTQALLEAYHALRSGQADRAIVVAYDSGIDPQALFYYNHLGLISPNHLTPFDKTHNGTILAEGAAALVLETEASVNARNARCYGEVMGGLSASEGAGLFGLQPDGEPLAELINDVLAQQRIAPHDIDWIVAHGNGNPASDNSEAKALDAVFPHKPPVTALKWAMGHTLCASGLIDAVMATFALEQGAIPGIADFEEQAPQVPYLNLSQATRTLDKNRRVLLISRGFASINACVVIKAHDSH